MTAPVSPPPASVGFSFDGRALHAREGVSIASALTEAGIRALRLTPTGAPRGMFCGMGVCQECLVVVNGQPSQRACMTPLTDGMEITTQPALSPVTLPLETTTTPAAQARHLTPDVLIIGGGAGGLSAATAAARAGASVILLDERKIAGGQYFKQSIAGLSPMDGQQAQGQVLLTDAHAAGVEVISQAEIWGAFDGPLIIAQHNDSALVIRPQQLIVATGAYERPVMVPGWTLPGVMTTGAAQTLWRSYRALAGKRVALFGSGPLNLQVASELAQGGAKVIMVGESAAAPWTRPLAALRMALRGPALAAKGGAIMARLRRHAVPVRFGTNLRRIDQDADGALTVHYETGGSGKTITVDALCMNAGFDPQNEIARLLGAAMHYDSAFGQLRTLRDARMGTNVPGLRVVGDCAGLGGAPAAMVEGQIAGRAAAAECGHGCDHDLFLAERELARHRRFQQALWQLYTPLPALPVDPETVICRCENITLAQIQTGMADAAHIGTMKRATRAGMGRCQGRYCSPVAVRLMAQATGTTPDDNSFFAPRVPIKPVSIGAIMAAESVFDDTL
ncbi:2Fe-2S iron-sulfur cluster-binding protein [Roseicitreum antarcticum]|uniref:Pyruvate/2-oxoglutarate dehydrogenase complex, dihydrolipoamide dehydrogenase (E3) component n=1 Tax=Roseicitreum antarcticum TaxID=564137 RepID=A0A1H2YY02_9RHOB|nr:2Fe-2S iron-sulfur cluster-binding protein [Roseicitreum antarcticum]SDX10043.1 Pyruvate/2-oxoglutarate dehydrogenase complex, dihydrolipoamide dehydrogenase (E3) component [Roseicitreum antarcticum]